MLKKTKQRRNNNNSATKMTTTAATVPSTPTTTTRRTPTQPRRQQQQKQQSNKNGNSNDSDETSNNNNNNNNNQGQNRFHKSSLYYNPYKSSGKNKAKRCFRHSVQRSVPMAPLFSEYFSNRSLSVKGLMGQFLSINVIETSSRKLWCPSSEKCSKRCCCIPVPYS